MLRTISLVVEAAMSGTGAMGGLEGCESGEVSSFGELKVGCATDCG